MFWFLILTKHFTVDFLLQTPYQYKNKGKLLHFGGLIHAFLHGFTTFLICNYLINFEISGFLYKFCKQHNIQILVRSFRDNIDIFHEENLARFNQDFNADLITMYIASNPNMKHISSSAIRMLLNAGESVKKYVPSNIVDICKI